MNLREIEEPASDLGKEDSVMDNRICVWIKRLLGQRYFSNTVFRSGRSHTYGAVCLEGSS